MRLITHIQSLLPGLWVVIITGFAALFLGNHYGAPVMLFALLLGIALSFLRDSEKCMPGIEFTACHVLRVGVALLGLRIAFGDLATLGWQTAILLFAAIGSTLLFGLVAARLMGLPKRFGVLTGGSVGICGASAAMAISAVMPAGKAQEQNTLLTIVGVTSLSTLAMIFYPILTSWLGLTDTQTSIFLGGTIHDVAQVVGAGYSVSEQTGDLATLTKLVRVAFLMPVVLCILITLRMNLGPQEGKPPGIPRFLIGFFALMVLNSVVSLPEVITKTASEVSRFALVIAIAAIGMKSNLGQLLAVGARPIVLMVLETLWIAGIILLGILML